MGDNSVDDRMVDLGADRQPGEDGPASSGPAGRERAQPDDGAARPTAAAGNGETSRCPAATEKERDATLEELRSRLARAEDAGAAALARAGETERLLEESRRHTDFLRAQLEEANTELRGQRGRVAALEEELRVARSFASLTDPSWIEAGLPGYRGAGRDREADVGSEDAGAEEAHGSGSAHQAVPPEPVEDLPEPFALDDLEPPDDAAEPRPLRAPRRRRIAFDFGRAADDVLPEEPPKTRKR